MIEKVHGNTSQSKCAIIKITFRPTANSYIDIDCIQQYRNVMLPMSVCKSNYTEVYEHYKI